MNRASRSPSARHSDPLRLRRQVLATLVAWAGLCGLACAQVMPTSPPPSTVLTIDSDNLFELSAFGRATVAEIERLGATLAAENREIEEALIAEEKELTELRATTAPADFRVLADAFDAKVQKTRRTQDTKSRELNAKLEEGRVVFLNAAVPVLEQLMRETGASVVLERRTVFISANSVDITQIAIQRLDAVLGEEDVNLE